MDVLQAQEAAAGETAYLIEKTDQQSFITLIAGVILSGEPSSADIPIWVVEILFIYDIERTTTFGATKRGSQYPQEFLEF